ncbi:MAG: ABC transporter ATP-binding protein [Nitrospinota bacterium]
MIEVENITKNYGRAVAVEGVSFRVEKGEILGFLGPNGAGKTTMMRIITCFMPPSSGRVVVAGYDCFTDPLEVKKRIGYMPESAPLYREMKVGEFLNFAAGIKRLKGKKKAEQTEKALELTGTADVSKKLIGKLSKGYRQRVCLAQALLGDPEALILDEPTAGLDPRQLVDIRQLIKSLSGERTIILSSHILPEVSLVCDRVVIIHKGKVVAEDSPKNLISQRQSENCIRLTVAGNPDRAEKLLAEVRGVLTVTAAGNSKDGECRLDVITENKIDIRRELAAAIVNSGLGLLELAQQQMSLEEIFVGLITDEEGGGDA